MRKVLLLSLSLALGFSAFAQQHVAKNDARQSTASAKKVAVGKETVTPAAANFAPQTAKSVVVNRYDNIEDGETMMTTYDLQSNHFCSNRMYQLPNGSAAIAATMSHEFNQSASDRGTGYNFYKDGAWGDMPESRIEDFRTGWPSIAPWKDGEILLCHGNSHMQCFVRDVAGEGEWRYMGSLPDYPEGYPYNEYPTWPRVVTCGENNHVIIAVGALQHQVSSDETHSHTVMWRSEDAENWTVSYGPIADLGIGYEMDVFSADDYCLAANGHTVALLYSGNLTNSVWMFKSTDDGLTWEPTKVWEHPFEGRSLDEVFDYGDTLFMPMNSAITIDNNGVAHVALNTLEMIHTSENEPGYYTYWSGRTVDGIFYWNDTQEAPIQDTYHPEYVGTPLEAHFANPNPFHALRLWWPIVDEPGYVHMVPDSTRWIGYLPMYEGYDWDNDRFYHESDYHNRLWGASGQPALSCDPYGNLCCAFSSPCVRRLDDNGTYYYRSIYTSYRNVDQGYWVQDVEDLCDEEVNFMFLYSDNLFTVSATNTYTPGEFWFGFQSDDLIGLLWDDGQTTASENVIHAMKITADDEYVSVPENYEAQDVVYGLYPNPATDYVVVKSSQDVEANISIVNLVGQTVKQFNKSLKMGENAINLDLKSGIYFCTISANGFNKTIKFVVK